MMRKLKNKGTCKLCNQVFDHEVIENHFKNCIEKNISDEQKTGPLVRIFRIKMFAGEKCWRYIDIVDIALLKDLDNFLKSMPDYGSEGAFYIRQSLLKKNNKTINRTFKKGTCFSYDYNPCGFYLEGKVIDCHNGFLDKKILFLAQNNSPFLECNDCVCKPKFTCVSCLENFCTKCLKKHPCGKDNVALIEDWEV